MRQVQHLVSMILIVTTGLVAYTLHFSDVSDYLLEDYMELEGSMTYNKDSNTITLHTTAPLLPVADATINKPYPMASLKLAFAHDDPKDLVVEDFGMVKVTGFYSRIHGVLMVEEITQTSSEIL